MTEGWLFDYGGTLDTGGQHWGKVLWHAYERHQIPVTEQQFREAYVQAERTLGKNPIIQPSDTFRKTLETKVRLQLEFLGIGAEESLMSILDDVYAIVVQQTAHSRDVLLQLKSRRPLVLVSNFYGNLSTVLREFGLDGVFEAVVESALVGVRKPDSRIFLLGAEALGLPSSKVTAVGDSLDKDIIPAKLAGCRTVWLQGEGWTAYDSSASEADRVIRSLDELLDKND